MWGGCVRLAEDPFSCQRLRRSCPSSRRTCTCGAPEGTERCCPCALCVSLGRVTSLTDLPSVPWGPGSKGGNRDLRLEPASGQQGSHPTVWLPGGLSDTPGGRMGVEMVHTVSYIKVRPGTRMTKLKAMASVNDVSPTVCVFASLEMVAAP